MMPAPANRGSVRNPKVPSEVVGAGLSHANPRTQSQEHKAYRLAGDKAVGGGRYEDDHQQTEDYGVTPQTEQGKFKLLQEQIEVVEEELAQLRKNRGEQLFAQDLTRKQIQKRMAEEKNKLKYLQESVKSKQLDLSQALQYSKVLDMENRVKELDNESAEVDRKLTMLERLKNKQLHCIEGQ